MNRFCGILPFIVMALVSIGVVTDALSAPSRKASRKPRITVESAVESLAVGLGSEYDEAQAFLQSAGDGLAARKAPVAAVLKKYPRDADVARRMLDMLSGFGTDGCSFAASLVSGTLPAFVADVLERYPGALRCPQLDRAVASIAGWAPDPSQSREAELFVLDVISAFKQSMNRPGAMAACAWLNAGPASVRIAAADLIAAVKPAKGLDCLSLAFDSEKNGDNRQLAGEYLEAIARFGGEAAFPHLLNAFNNVNHFEKACAAVVRAGDAGMKTLVRAVRSTSGRDPLLRECFSRHAAVSRPYVLALLGDRSRDMRRFALDFFTVNHFPDALERFKAGFRISDSSVVPDIPREDLFEAMASYPVEEISDMVELALADNDDRIRDRALELIQKRKSLAFAPALRTVAEFDPNRVSRIHALKIITMLMDTGAEPLIRKIAEYEETTVATEAARVLGFIGSQESIDVLRKLARTHKGTERGLVALQALAFLGITRDPMNAMFVGKVEPKSRKVDGAVTCGRFQAARTGSRGPLLIALPGGPGMNSAWTGSWIDEIARKATVARVEPVNRDNPTDALLSAQELDCLVESMGHDKAILVGEGLGGTSAMWLAFQAPARVAGLVTISAPLPGSVSVMEQVMLRNLPQPFDAIARDLIERSAEFRPAAINYYLLKALSPVMAGGIGKATRAMHIGYDSERLVTARSELSRSEVRFSAMEVDRPALWILPAEMMLSEEFDPYRALAAERPDKYRVFSIDRDCGTSPGISCPGVLVKQIRRFIADM